jgi:hypothetical protein
LRLPRSQKKAPKRSTECSTLCRFKARTRTHCAFQNTRNMNAPAPSDMSRNSQVDTKRDRNFFKSMARTIKEKRAICPHDPAWPAARQMQVQQRTHEQPAWHLIEDDRACTHVGSRREKLTKLCSDMVQRRCGHFGFKGDVVTLYITADTARARGNT